MTHAERAARLSEIEEITGSILCLMDSQVRDTASTFKEEKEELERNQQLVKSLIAKVRTLGKDASDTIQYTAEAFPREEA